MKTIFFFLLITITLNCKSQVNVTYGQYGTRPNVNLNLGLNTTTPIVNGINNSSLKRGPVLFFTGLTLIGASIITQPDVYTTPSGFQVEKPFLQQGLKTYFLLGGSVFTTIGTVFIIKDGNPNKKKHEQSTEDKTSE